MCSTTSSDVIRYHKLNEQKYYFWKIGLSMKNDDMKLILGHKIVKMCS